MAEPSVKSDGSGGYTFSWNHCVNSPNMEVIGSVSSDGKYSVRFYKHGTGSFGYTYNIKVNGTSIFSYGVGDIKENVNIDITKNGTVSTKSFKLVVVCGDTGCDNGASGSGRTIIDVNLYTPPSWDTLSVDERTTKSIKIKATWNDVNNNLSTNDADAVIVLYNSNKQEIKRGTAYSRDGSYVTFDNLSHNTTYYYNAYLTDAGNGGSTSALWYDPGYLPTSTKKLGCTSDTSVTNQTSISANFYATVDDSTSFSQSGIKCSNAELQDGSGVKIKDLTKFDGTSGTISATGLTSYTKYKLKCNIYDGYNTVDKIVDFTTLFPYARIQTNNGFKKAIPYIYTNGSWHLAKGHVYSNSEFHEFNGQ